MPNLVEVTFKCEIDDDDGELIGSVKVIDVDARSKDLAIVWQGDAPPLIPFGYKPDWISDEGWLTRTEALAIAQNHGVVLEEY
jgi:hypothetical protein